MTAWTDAFAPFVAWLGRNSLQACLLVGLLLALQALLRDRISPRWRYALWLILVAKLALPWSPPSRLSVYNILPHVSTNAVTSAVDYDPAIAEPSAPSADDAIAQLTPSALLAPASTPPASAPLVAEPTPAESTFWQRLRASFTWPTLTTLLPIVWLAGALLVAIATVLQAIHLGAVRRQRFVTDQATLDLLEDCKQQMAVPAYLAVVETSRVASPALFGFLRPRLLLPPGAIADLGPHRLRHVFLHELAHLKRHDIPVNWLLALLQILHWFNPLVWYAFARMRSDRELACDALALSHTNAPDPHDYGRTIVDMLETFVQPRHQPNLAGVLEDKSQLKRRITMIAQFRKSPHSWSLPVVTLLVLIGAVALTNAQTPQPTPASPTTAELVRIARQVVTDMAKGDFTAVTGQFDAKMKSVLSPKDLQAAWDAVAREAGPFQEQLAVRTEQFGAYKIVFVTARFQQGPVDVKVVFDKAGRISGLFLVPTPIAPNGSASTQPSAISFADKDLRIAPYKEGGLFYAVASVHNSSAQPSEKWDVRFYLGEPKKGNEAGPGGPGGIGPIEPNGTWHEASLPFALQDGTHTITAVLTPAGQPEAAAGMRAVVTVTVRDGKIVSQTPGTRGAGQPAAGVSFGYENVTIEPYEEGKLFTVVVRLQNPGDSPTPRYTLRYFRGDPRDAIPAGPNRATNINPIAPAGKGDAGSLPFALADGSHVITCVLRPANAPPNVPSQSVAVLVTVKNGKIVSQEPAGGAAAGSADAREQGQPQAAAASDDSSLPGNLALLRVRLTEATADGAPVAGAGVTLWRKAGEKQDRSEGGEAVTDERGTTLLQVPAGTYCLQISLPSKQWYRKTLDLKGGQKTDLSLLAPTGCQVERTGKVQARFPRAEGSGDLDFLVMISIGARPTDPLPDGTVWQSDGCVATFSIDGKFVTDKGFGESSNILGGGNSPEFPVKMLEARNDLELHAGPYFFRGIYLYRLAPKDPVVRQRPAPQEPESYRQYEWLAKYEFPQGQSPTFDVRPDTRVSWPIDLPANLHRLVTQAPPPQEGRSLTDQAQKLFESKRYDQAMAIFQQVVDKYPGWSGAANAQMMIGLCYDNMGQKDKAMAAFERTVQEYPSDDLAATYFYLGSAYERADRPDDALAAYQQSAQRAEWIGRSTAFPGSNAKERIAALKQGTPPQEGRTLTDQAQKLFESKRYDQAMAMFQQVVERYPRWSGAENAQMMIGLCYDHLGQNDKAIAAFERAVQGYPNEDLAATYFYLGSAYERAERLEDAAKAYKQSLQRADRIGRGNAFPGQDAKARIEALRARATSSKAQ